MQSILIDCFPIGSHRMRRADQHRILLVDGNFIQFSQTQYQILLLLLQGGPVSDRDFAGKAFACPITIENHQMLKRNLKKHIDVLRGKLRMTGLTIRRIMGYGYVLQEDEEEVLSFSLPSAVE